MDWVAAIWNKINKPLHFLFVGAALALFAPTGVNWTGNIFIAAGLAGSVEWAASKISKWRADHRQINNLRQIIATQNAQEKSILQEQIKKGEQTFYPEWNNYHGPSARPGDADEYDRLSGIYLGLRDKGVLNITTEDTTAVLHIVDPSWGLVRRALNSEATK